ncbi:phytoene synthase [Chamaesiphon sp.]|uniref:phytoene synthase n=1 Tax=Chamaesiphon sp. TaxID=2814140 RepID=UPI0035932F26
MLQLEKSLSIVTMLTSTEESYELCRQITAEYGKTFYLATLLMSVPKRRAIWAIYAWCRNTDELVDGADADETTPATLDRWESQLEGIFRGIPTDKYDVALVDTIARFPDLEIQPFRDMITGQRMDLRKNRYYSFEELSLYCYRVAGTVGLMSNAIVGVDESQFTAPWSEHHRDIPTEQAVALGIGKQLTNILRDVGEDSERGRIYLPLDELALFNYTETDLMNQVVNDNWRALMKFQIQRARKYYQQAESGISRLSPDVRWPVWAALLLYQQILDSIERNDYDVFTRRAFVSMPRKLWCLPGSLIRAQVK